jgi:NADPH-dependent ferric siderophore reductase
MVTSPGRLLLGRLFNVGAIEDVEQVTPRMRRVRMSGTAIKGLGWRPGQQVRLHVNDILAARTWLSGAVRDVLRTYSIWDCDPAAGTLDLVMLDHGGDAPGAVWTRRASAGQEVVFSKPQGDFVVREGAPYHLFAGEETASVAFGAMLRALPADAWVWGAVEAATDEDHLDLPRSADLTRVTRDGAPAAGSELLVEAVRALVLPDEPGVAYLAGEARTVQAIRAHLVTERGWHRRNVVTKPFWTPGKRGME